MKKTYILILLILSSCSYFTRPIDITNVVIFEIEKYSPATDNLFSAIKSYFKYRGVKTSFSAYENSTANFFKLPLFKVVVHEYLIRHSSIASIATKVSQRRQVNTVLSFSILYIRDNEVIDTKTYDQSLIRYTRYDATNLLGYDKIVSTTLKNLKDEHSVLVYNKVRDYAAAKNFKYRQQ